MITETGKMEFSCTIPDGGHFEKGRWVTLFSPLLDYLKDEIGEKEQTFEVKLYCDIPVFKQGACTGYRKKEIIRIFTQRQLQETFEFRLNDNPSTAGCSSLGPEIP